MKLKLNSPSAQTHTIYIGHIPVTYGQPRVRVSLFPTIALWLTDCKIVKWIVIVLNLIPFSFLLYTFSSSTLQHCVGMPFTLGSDLYLALRFLPLGSFSSWKRTNQPFHLYRRPHSEGQACEMKTVYTCIRFALHALQTHRIASLWRQWPRKTCAQISKRSQLLCIQQSSEQRSRQLVRTVVI